jgi:hypothetical protein
MYKKTILLMLLLISMVAAGIGQDSNKVIPAGSKIFIGPISDGFESHLIAALNAKNVPVEIVDDKANADFEISGSSESKKAGAAKILLRGSWHSSEQASITLTNLKSGESIWAYSVNKSDSARGKRSTAEACAKHLKKKIDSGK